MSSAQVSKVPTAVFAAGSSVVDIDQHRRIAVRAPRIANAAIRRSADQLANRKPDDDAAGAQAASVADDPFLSPAATSSAGSPRAASCSMPCCSASFSPPSVGPKSASHSRIDRRALHVRRAPGSERFLSSRVGAPPCRRAALPRCFREPQHLAPSKPIQCCCLRSPDPLLQPDRAVDSSDRSPYGSRIAASAAAPHPISIFATVTALAAPTVTSLSGV